MIYKFVLTFIISVIMVSSMAMANNTKVILYEDFVTFTQEQKIESIKLVHQFLTEYERLSIYERSKKSTKRKYQTYKKIVNFFIQSAYADDSTLNLKMSDSMKDKLCYYAGWMSYSYNGFCSHPKNLDSLISQGIIKSNEKTYFQSVADEYKNQSAQNENTKGFKSLIFDVANSEFKLQDSTKCNVEKDIVCNPKIYGSVDGTTPFCVPGNREYGLNSSLMCSQAGEALKKEDEGKYNSLMLQIAKNAVDGGPQDDFFYTLRAMYETCLCAANGSMQEDKNGSVAFTGSIDYAYANKIFYSRTCYGIINQTQNIFEAFSSNKDYVCKQEGFPALQVNGPDSISYSWNEYLIVLNKQIEKQKIKEEIKNQLEYMSASFYTKKQNREQIIADYEKDNRQFKATRNNHFIDNKKEKLCPIGHDLRSPDDNDNNEIKEDKLEATFAKNEDPAKDPNGKITASIIFAADETDEVTIMAKDADGKEIEPVEKVEGQKPSLSYFTVPQKDKEYIVMISGTVSGKELEPVPVTIPALKYTGPHINISVTDAEGDLAKTHSLVALSIVIPGKDDDSEEKTAEDASSLKLESKKEGADLKDQSDEKDKTKKVYLAKKLDEDYEVTASGQYEEKDLPNETATIQQINEDKDPAATKECSATLAFAEGEAGPKLDLSYTYDGKSYPEGETNQPPSDKVNVSIKWYDQIAPDPIEETKETKTKTVSDLKTEKIEEKKEEKKEEKDPKNMTEAERNIASIKKDLKPYDENDSVLSMQIVPSPQKRTIGVIITFNEGKNLTCETSATLEVDGQNNDPKFDNNNPVTTPQPPSRQRSRGTFLGGQH